jgi:hypothetical protein
MRENRKAYRILVGKPEGKRPLGRSRHRLVDNVKMDLGDIEWCWGEDFTGLFRPRIGTGGKLSLMH